jgi:hypothetical protein
MAGGHMSWRVRSAFGDVEIELHPSKTADDAAREDSVRELSRLVYDFKARQPEARRTLLEIHARLHGVTWGGGVGDPYQLDSWSVRAETIGADLLRRAQAGALVLRRPETRSVVVPLDADGDAEELLGPQSDQEAETTWIAIELVGEDGLPIPGEAYQITLPDGSIREGILDSAGKAMLRGIDPGQCGVTFPRLDQQTWGPAGG